MTRKKLTGKNTKKIEVEASLTIEAALGLTVFIFTVIMLLMPMKMLDTQRQVQMVLESASREISQYAYILYRKSEGEADLADLTERENGALPETSALFTKAAAAIYLKGKIEAATGKGRVGEMDFSGTSISENGEEIDLRVEYRLRLPFSIFSLKSVPAASRSLRRGWIGSEGGRGELNRDGQTGEDTIVYVGATMGRYHLSKSCHYLSNDITGVSFDAIGEVKNGSGSHYQPCSVCGKGAVAGSNVYVMPNGKYYHSRRDCSSIGYYVREVPLREVEYLGACSYCGKGK